MKKVVLFLFAIVLMVGVLSACDTMSSVEKYYLDDNGNLIAEYNNGSTVDLGTLSDTIANGIDKCRWLLCH